MTLLRESGRELDGKVVEPVTITDDDTGGSGDGRGSGEITGVGCHVGGGTAVHEREVTYATNSASVGGSGGCAAARGRPAVTGPRHYSWVERCRLEAC
jgi:hypothetical protein